MLFDTAQTYHQNINQFSGGSSLEHFQDAKMLQINGEFVNIEAYGLPKHSLDEKFSSEMSEAGAVVVQVKKNGLPLSLQLITQPASDREKFGHFGSNVSISDDNILTVKSTSYSKDANLSYKIKSYRYKFDKVEHNWQLLDSKTEKMPNTSNTPKDPLIIEIVK